jgi:hypothetical protein
MTGWLLVAISRGTGAEKLHMLLIHILVREGKKCYQFF